MYEKSRSSRAMRRPQKTLNNKGYSGKGEVELQNTCKARSIAPARSDGNIPGQSDNTLFNQILSRENLNAALKQVIKNKGAAGVDRVTFKEFKDYLIQNWVEIKKKLIEGTYQPSPVRRVEIPKPDGGKRNLGIPTLLDRLIQQATAQILTPIYEKKFSNGSYGFRPGRSAHQAVKQAREYIESGYKWVIDIDLEKFFDRVNHDILMALLSKDISDKAALKLIRKYLESGVMINGVVAATEVGTPQGGPLSPLLANIMLDVLDKELEKRGHKFCRYADDCNIYVKSSRAGKRVMESVKEFIESRLKLRINPEKSAVDRPMKRKFLGFTNYYKAKGGIGIAISAKSKERLRARLKELTSRSNGKSMEKRIESLNQYLVGWLNYYMLADMSKMLTEIEEWLRRRIRMCLWKAWKRIKAKGENLRKLGLDKEKAYEYANTRKGYWRIANSPILKRTVTNKYIEELGLVTIGKYYLKLRSS